MPTRRRLLAWGALGAAGVRAADDPWPLWQAFAARFIQADGRVIDDQHETRYTTSEGQAYSLFFALAAGERERFDKLLEWTDRHLAGGELGRRLPGWRWGRHDDGRWTLVDDNAAADADLWLAHTLFEAAGRWEVPRYAQLARALAARIVERETVALPGAGPAILPGPQGFRLEGGQVRLNPSYFVLPQLRALARHHPEGPWAPMAEALPRLLQGMAPRGLVPDWVLHDPRKGWMPDRQGAGIGSYDAIRSYLWAGLTAPDDPLQPALLQATRGLLPLLGREGTPPRRIHTGTGGTEGAGPAGFSAALLPWLQALGRPALVARQQARLRTLASGALVGQPPGYYDQVLALFGTGALEGRFGFDRDGRLLVQ